MQSKEWPLMLDIFTKMTRQNACHQIRPHKLECYKGHNGHNITL